VLSGERAIGAFSERQVVPGAAVVYADPLYQAPYYTTTENANDDAWDSSFSPLGLMAVAAFSATGFAIGRRHASLGFGAERAGGAVAAPEARVPVLNLAGEAAGDTGLALRTGKNPEVLGHIVHRKLVLERRNLRHGSANTKTRGEVRGGGRKPYQQKGTGRARRGSTRSPLIRGGGVIFGPKPKNWANKKMNRKEARLAIGLAFQSRAPSMTVVKDLETGLSAPKTKDMFNLLKTLGIGMNKHGGGARGKLEPTSVIVGNMTPEEYKTMSLSTRNMKYIKLVSAKTLSVYDLLRPEKLIVSERALASIKDQYGADAANDDSEPVAEEDGYAAGADNVEDDVDDIIDEMEEVLGEDEEVLGDDEMTSV